MKKVLIGVQARSTSSRLRGKCSMFVGERSIVGTVMAQSIRCAGWFRSNADVTVAMLIPEGDDLKGQYKHKYEIFEGPEDDVLTRYVQAMNHYDADYVCRLTGDCVWITSSIIAKCIREALKRETDYCSNILMRTFMEGLDCEVLSRKALMYLDENMKEADEREHVTSGLVQDIKAGVMGDHKIHTIVSEYDHSDLKTSIDTKDEYVSCLKKFEDLRVKKKEALAFGSISN